MALPISRSTASALIGLLLTSACIPPPERVETPRPAPVPPVQRPAAPAPPPKPQPQPQPQPIAPGPPPPAVSENAPVPPPPAWQVRTVAPSAVEVKPSTYIVKPGDTLRAISNKTGAGSET